MAQDDKASLKAAKKQERAAKREHRKQTRSQMWQAFNMQRKQDKALIPIMLAAFLGMGLLFFLIGLLFNGQCFMLILGLGIGALLAMWLFTRRLERDMYKKVGSARCGWLGSEQQLRNTVGIVWKVKTAVGVTRHQDLIHRVIGNAGVIFVCEGDRKRLTPVLNTLKKRVDARRWRAGLRGLGWQRRGRGSSIQAAQSRDEVPRNFKRMRLTQTSARLRPWMTCQAPPRVCRRARCHARRRTWLA